MSAAAALVGATARIAPVSATPRLDAELLLAHALGLERQALLLDLPAIHVPHDYEALVDRRAGGEPVAYILGWRDFWDMRLMVTPDVLVPRADSETLVEAVPALGLHPGARLLDLGTGSGALLLAALRLLPGARGTGVDRSEAALAVARRNAGAHGLENRARFVAADWSRPGWEDVLEEGRYDLILANPPYVEEGAADAALAFEPAGALFAGPDGLDDYRRLVPLLPRLLQRDGHVLMEIGAAQALAVGGLAADAGMEVRVLPDLAGRDRALHMRLGPNNATA